jgi:parallel beta-helix repeat protein
MRKIRQLGIVVLVVLASFMGMANLMSQGVEGTTVSGHISSDTTWSTSGSPYIIMGNTTVQNGATLTIHPGVEVRFDGFYALYIDGGLTAKGTPTSKIIMTSNKLSPAPMDWFSVTINSTGDAEIEYAEISYGWAAISLADTNRTIISNNAFSNNGIGIYGGTSNSVICNNEISDNLGHGIILYTMFTGLRNNTVCNNDISNNGGSGIFLYSAYANNVIEYNSLNSNYWNIFLSSSKDTYIENNTISNGEHGILMLFSWNNTIAHNDVYDAVNGISMNYTWNTTIMHNNVMNNALGLNISSDSSNNTIYHNYIIGNTDQAIDDSDSNFWNVTYSQSPLMGGNYWSDYSPTCQDSFDGSATPQTTGAPDGICDNPNVIGADSIDYYPLTRVPDTEPPRITNLQPSHLSTTSDDTPLIGANYSDGSGIDTSTLVFEVNGVDVSTAPSTVVTATGVGYAPETALIDGDHNVYLEVKDTMGNTATSSWSFTVATTSDTTPPVVTDLEPANGSTINVSVTVISANYSDSAGINISSVLLKIDDVDATADATVTQDGVTYIPTDGLSEGSHNVYLEVKDINGNMATGEWNFTVEIHEPSPAPSDFLSEYWWIILIIVLAMVAGLAIIMVWRKKNGGKKEKQDEGKE